MDLLYTYANLSQGFVLAFVLVLSRIGALIIAMPFMSARETPKQVRVVLAVGAALLLTPMQDIGAIPQPRHLIDLVLMMAGEGIVGLSLGVSVMVLFTGLQLAGQIVGQMSGMQLASVIDPNFNSQTPLFGRLFDLVTTAVFFITGGHRQVIQAVLDTFAWMPPGEAAFSRSMLDTLTACIASSFILGVQAAAPVLVSLLLSILVLGLLSRTMQQLNVMSLGFSLNSMVMMLTIWVSLGAIVWIFQNEAGNLLDKFYVSLMSS